MLKLEELEKRSDQELEDDYLKLSRGIFDLLNELRLSKKLKQPHLLKEKKRDRARVLTVLREREIKGMVGK